jgi:hypothetical protein
VRLLLLLLLQLAGDVKVLVAVHMCWSDLRPTCAPLLLLLLPMLLQLAGDVKALIASAGIKQQEEPLPANIARTLWRVHGWLLHVSFFVARCRHGGQGNEGCCCCCIVQTNCLQKRRTVGKTAPVPQPPGRCPAESCVVSQYDCAPPVKPQKKTAPAGYLCATRISWVFKAGYSYSSTCLLA